MTAGPNVQALLAALRLNLVSGIGPRLAQALLTELGSIDAIFAAGTDRLQQVPGIGKKLASEIVDTRYQALAELEVGLCRDASVNLLTRGSDAYPRMLGEICDPPGVLYSRGTIEARDEIAVAIVGARRCTLYGRQQAERLAGQLSRAGVTIVSGLARGVDASAHLGAISAGGRTIAVLATGLSKIYPPEHAELANEISGAGAVVSESHMGQAPIAGLFPQRNRIISGLSLGVIVVEASRKSGALHTARHALEQGREVFAVPGRIDSLASEGCHDLIRDGVPLIRGADDVLEALGPLISPVKRAENDEVHSPRELTLNEQEREVLNHLSLDPLHVDDVLRAANLDSSRVLATLTVLEMKRMVRRLPGGYFARWTG